MSMPDAAGFPGLVAEVALHRFEAPTAPQFPLGLPDPNVMVAELSSYRDEYQCSVGLFSFAAEEASL